MNTPRGTGLTAYYSALAGGSPQLVGLLTPPLQGGGET